MAQELTTVTICMSRMWVTVLYLYPAVDLLEHGWDDIFTLYLLDLLTTWPYITQEHWLAISIGA